jgi:hypothetical protein
MAEAKEKIYHQCARCGTTSKERPLLPTEMDGDNSWICVSCLPYLIHGGH